MAATAVGSTGAAVPAHRVALDPAVTRAYDGARSVVAAPVLRGDRRLDAVVVANDSLRIYPQRADGRLGDPRVRRLPGAAYPYFPQGLDTGDLDGDGTRDIVVAVNAGIVVLYGTGRSIGQPTLLRTTDAASYVRIADFDRNGRNDIVFSSGTGLDVLWNTKTGFESTRIADDEEHRYEVAMHIQVGDLTGDGRLDVAACGGPQCKTLRVFASLGGRAFERTDYPIVLPDTQCSSVGGVAVGDLDDDGRSDAVVLGRGCSEAIMIFRQQPGGRLEQTGTHWLRAQLGGSIQVKDMNADGRADVVILHGSDPFRPVSHLGIFRQRTGGRFYSELLYDLPDTSYYQSTGLAVGDIDKDRRPDFLVASYEWGLVLRRQRSVTR